MAGTRSAHIPNLKFFFLLVFVLDLDFQDFDCEDDDKTMRMKMGTMWESSLPRATAGLHRGFEPTQWRA